MNGAFLAALIFVFILAGMPIAFSTGLTSVITMAATESLKWASILLREINGIATFTLLAIPLYMLAGKLMNACGVTDRLFGLARALVGWIPGGLGHVNVLASVIFAGMSGSAVADVSGLGIIEIKSMDDAGFDHMDSCCITAASAMIGPIIPPSIVMVVYAISSGASVGALFMAGFLPGLLMGLALMTYIFIRSFRKRYPQDPFPTFRSFFIALKRGILPMMTPVIILAGIYTGIFTATEAAAISVVYTAVLGFFVYHTLTLKTFWVMIRETARETAGIGLLIASAALFGNIIVKSMLPQTIMKFVLTFIHSRISFILLVVLVLLFTGMFMEASSVITILTPILMPLVKNFGINPVHFGVFMLINIVLGGLTPPVGMTGMVTSRVGRIPFAQFCRHIIPWYLTLWVAMFLVAFFPEISLFIPRMAGLLT